MRRALNKNARAQDITTKGKGELIEGVAAMAVVSGNSQFQIAIRCHQSAGNPLDLAMLCMFPNRVEMS